MDSRFLEEHNPKYLDRIPGSEASSASSLGSMYLTMALRVNCTLHDSRFGSRFLRERSLIESSVSSPSLRSIESFPCRWKLFEPGKVTRGFYRNLLEEPSACHASTAGAESHRSRHHETQSLSRWPDACRRMQRSWPQYYWWLVAIGVLTTPLMK